MTGYSEATTAAAVFARPLGMVLLAGPDAPQFLHNISTNDIAPLPLGGGCETYLCDARAKALFVAWVSHVKVDGRNALWVDTTPGKAADLLKHLDRFLIAEAVELADVTDRNACVHVAGPAAADVLATATGSPVPPLAAFQHMERTVAGVRVSVRRRDWLGVPGFDVVSATESADPVRAALVGAGATPGDGEAFETLRVEAGTPVQGVDWDETRFVMEIGHASRAVSYAKGCFPGQEPIVMARDRAGRVNRQFLRLAVVHGTVPAGTKLSVDGADAGLVTSVAHSPRQGRAVAAGYVGWKHVAAGTRLRAGVAEVEVLGPPL